MTTRCLGCKRRIPTGTPKGRCNTCRAELYAARRIPPSLRRAVFERDHGWCQIGRPGCTGRATEVDHIIPLAQGGTTTFENCRAACKACNSGRRDRA